MKKIAIFTFISLCSFAVAFSLNFIEEKKIIPNPNIQNHKYIIIANTISGGSPVFSSENKQEIAQWLIKNNSYHAHIILDGGYCIQSEGKYYTCQGYAEFDHWIDLHKNEDSEKEISK